MTIYLLLNAGSLDDYLTPKALDYQDPLFLPQKRRYQIGFQLL